MSLPISPRSPSRLVVFGYFCLLIALGLTLFWPHTSQAGFSVLLAEQRAWLAQPVTTGKTPHAPPEAIFGGIPPRSKTKSNSTATKAQVANWRSSRDGAGEDQTFVAYQNEKGEFTCRKATPEERRGIVARNGGGLTRVIYSGAPRQKDLPDETRAWTSDESPGLTLAVSAGLRIVLHGTTQLNQNQVAKAAFIAAANRWEAIISTPITVVIDVDFGATFFGTPYPNPNIIGATGLDTVVGPFSDLRQRLIDRASTTAEQQLYNALPAAAVPVELNGMTSEATSTEATTPNARALGIVPDITDPDSLPLGQGDAGIGFNSAFQFDFDPADGISSGQTDFDSVASHEIGHALGFISSSGDNTSSPVSVWDLFRFRPSTASLATFATAPRTMSQGGTQVFFGNQTSTYATLELGLSTGGPNPGPSDGDGRQSSHWKDDSLLSTRPYIGVMDPTLGSGLRRTISENDIMAIDLFGYSIGAPAPVRPPNDNFVNALVLLTNAGTLSGTNVSATREAGEPIHVGYQGDKSVWYSWVSPLNGQMTIDTIGSSFDTTLAVYVGPALNQLGNIAQNDDIVAGTNRASRVQFNITAGTTYRIVVDGWNSEYGNITLTWSATGSVPSPTPTPTPSPSPTPSPTPTPTPPCLDDTWTPTSMTNVPLARKWLTAVWTGTEMLVWGGWNDGALNTGSRYNPITNSWTAMSTTNAPAARAQYSAVWTGTEMIVWGGFDTNSQILNGGGRYNPATNSWSPISSTNEPGARIQHSAVWTGSEMIVWGGFNNGLLKTGGRYNPATNSWTTTDTTNAPIERSAHTATWVGGEMIVWGGFNNGSLNTGGRYNPTTDTWTTTSLLNAPSARGEHSAVWDGSEIIIWGGTGGGLNFITNTGAKYIPGTDSWTTITTTNAPLGRLRNSIVWTGTEMIVWGGLDSSFNDLSIGGRYSPASNTWISTCDLNGPSPRTYPVAVWTGGEMIIWGGDQHSNTRLDTGGRYFVQGAPMQLILDTSGPAVNQVAAMDSLLFLRDPFPVMNAADFLNLGSDRNTRVIVVVTNLHLAQGEPSSAVVVNLIDANNQSYDIPAEDVRSIPNSSLNQVIFRLADNLPVGACTIKVKAHAQVTNAGTIRIRT